ETGYHLPGSGTANVSFQGTDNTVLKQVSLPLTPHGTFSGSFTLGPDENPGEYSINTSAFGADNTHSVECAAYRKPEFTVEVKSTKPYFVLGQRASAKVKCLYYFGGPVVG